MTEKINSEIESSLFRPEDAPGFIECGHSLYKNGNSVRLFNNSSEAIETSYKRMKLSVVDRTKEGCVVGVENLYRSDPFSGLNEAGAGLVSGNYQEQGINNRLLRECY